MRLQDMNQSEDTFNWLKIELSRCLAFEVPTKFFLSPLKFEIVHQFCYNLRWFSTNWVGIKGTYVPQVRGEVPSLSHLPVVGTKDLMSTEYGRRGSSWLSFMDGRFQGRNSLGSAHGHQEAEWKEQKEAVTLPVTPRSDQSLSRPTSEHLQLCYKLISTLFTDE